MNILERFRAPANNTATSVEINPTNLSQNDVTLTGDFERRYLAAEQEGSLSDPSNTFYDELLDAARGDTVRASRYMMDLMVEYSDQL